MITIEEYKELIEKGFTHIPLVKEVLTDFDTPLSLYLKLANKPMTYLLESVINAERFGRYSYIGLECTEFIKVNNNKISYFKDNKLAKEIIVDDVLKYIDSFYKSFKVPTLPNIPRFNGGLVGYFSFECMGYIEKRLEKLFHKSKLIEVPDILLLVSTKLIVLDNLSGKSYLIVYANKEEDSYLKAKKNINRIYQELRSPVYIPISKGFKDDLNINYEIKQSSYEAYVKKIKKYIEDGDCMQVVPSQRMFVNFEENPLNFYRALRTINPSPYLIYYNFGDFFVVGSSPEILVRRESNKVFVRPLAGTAKRGKNKEEDEELIQKLLNNEKEVAEHVMLIDLGRNDLGKVAQTGTVNVTDKMIIEKYSHVMHIVSNVECLLKDGLSNIDIFKAVFIAGTLSGAPKIRAIEIIDELEPTQRGIYSGAIGLLGFNHDMDLAITIRTAVIKDGVMYIQSGAGIVLDSDPKLEWEETQNKAMAIIKTLDVLKQGLDV